MLLEDGRRSRGRASFIMDMIHIAVSCLMALMAVLAFWDPDRNMLLFPIIFFLGAALYLVTGVHQLRSCGRVRRRRAAAAALTALGAALLILTVVSAVSIWWG